MADASRRRVVDLDQAIRIARQTLADTPMPRVPEVLTERLRALDTEGGAEEVRTRTRKQLSDDVERKLKRYGL